MFYEDLRHKVHTAWTKGGIILTDDDLRTLLMVARANRHTELICQHIGMELGRDIALTNNDLEDLVELLDAAIVFQNANEARRLPVPVHAHS